MTFDENNQVLMNGNMLNEMDKIPNNSVDMILTDLPYGTTGCSWDTIIPFDLMWEQYKRVIKENGAIVLFGSQPFTSKLITSNIENYKYDWIWDKVSVSNPQLAKIQPLKNYETISVFGKKGIKTNYYPQGLQRIKGAKKTNSSEREGVEKLGHISRRKDYVQEFTNYPKAIIENPRPANGVHPTQKPTDLLEYLIKTYTIAGETVLDSTMGSGSTGVACLNTDRKFIGIELDEKYFEIAKGRMKNNQNQLGLF